MGRTDVVLMDLRCFSYSNDGCIFEIQELLNAVPPQRVIFVTDTTSDKNFFAEVLQDSWRTLPPDSPNREVSISKFGLFEIRSAAHDEVAALLRRLCYATAGAR